MKGERASKEIRMLGKCWVKGEGYGLTEVAAILRREERKIWAGGVRKLIAMAGCQHGCQRPSAKTCGQAVVVIASTCSPPFTRSLPLDPSSRTCSQVRSLAQC